MVTPTLYDIVYIPHFIFLYAVPRYQDFTQCAYTILEIAMYFEFVLIDLIDPMVSLMMIYKRSKVAGDVLF
jgi:hypothetical protein